MITNKKGDNLISVLIGTFIIAIIILGIINILSSNYVIEDDYSRSNKILLLQYNTTNIVRALDTSFLNEGDIFYIYKDVENKNFLIKTGIGNEQYKYINEFGDNISNTGTYASTMFARMLYVQKNDTTDLGPKNQILKVGIRELIRK
ncbi:hypothetical protein KAZ01_01625 [Candidatus Gracilibacteria bacterium]|nr:hypothetical protein [Candidatus Gracilibacteria bacterium]